MSLSRIALALALSVTPALAAPPSQPASADRSPDVPQTGPEADRIARTLADVTLPKGFHIALFALAPGARGIAVSPSGRVAFVGTMGRELYALSLTPGGDKAGAVKLFAPQTSKFMPNGVCFSPEGTLFVTEQNRVDAFTDVEGFFTGAEAFARTVVPLGELIPVADQSSNHSARVCRVGPDGKLYVALGQPYNVPPAAKLAHYDALGIGGIVRMGQDGSGREVFAHGIRNSVGLDFNPADGTLWFTDNQVDLMGEDIPPGELNRATRAGQNFGFPWYGGGHVRTHEYAGATPPADVVFPQVEMVAHAADLGMTFLRGASVPAAFKGGIVSAQHGSWNRVDPIGARLMFTRLKPDGTAEATMPFAEGWRRPDGHYAGRPVDVAETPDGALLVTDDDNGAVYKITWDKP